MGCCDGLEAVKGYSEEKKDVAYRYDMTREGD